MQWLEVVVRLVLSFVLGTVVLWFCSYSVNTRNRNIRTAALCNAIMTGLEAILLCFALIYVSTESDVAAVFFFVSLILTLVISFLVLKVIYEISFWATVWLVFVTWAVEEGVKHVVTLTLPLVTTMLSW